MPPFIIISSSLPAFPSWCELPAVIRLWGLPQRCEFLSPLILLQPTTTIAVIFIFSSKSIICFFNFALFYSQVCSLLFVFRFIIAPLSFYCSFFCVCFVCFSVCLSYKLPFDCVHACLCGHLTMIWGLRVCWADALPTRVFGSPS